MKEKLASHDPYADLDVRTDRIKRWHPLNQSLYVGYKMLPGMLLLSKGDRTAMNASIETRYPYLDENVIAFCAQIAPEYKLRGMTEKWIFRQVAARILTEKITNRPKLMF
jgi:asparagine synthase (glutamine-hydrolysing)